MNVLLEMDDRELMHAMARLTQIPLAKVVRNAARDFAKGAYQATPLARISRSEFYAFRDTDGNWRYLHQSQVGHLTRKKRQAWKAASGFHKVRIGKGWSRATWGGVFEALGLPKKNRAAGVPEEAKTRSTLETAESTTQAEMTITDLIRFDRFGRGGGYDSTPEIIAAGMERARASMTRELARRLKNAWRNPA